MTFKVSPLRAFCTTDGIATNFNDEELKPLPEHYKAKILTVIVMQSQ